MLGGSEGSCACGRSLGAVRRLRRASPTPGARGVHMCPNTPSAPISGWTGTPLKPTAASLQRAGLMEQENTTIRPVPQKEGCGAEDCVETRREGWKPTCNIAKVFVNAEVRTVKPVPKGGPELGVVNADRPRREKAVVAVGKSPCEDENKQLANLPSWGRAGRELAGWARLESIFWCLWGQAALLSGHTTPPHGQLSELGRTGTVSIRESEDTGGGQTLVQPRLPTRSGCARHCVRKPTPLLFHIPKTLSTFISHPNRHIWRHTQPDVRLLTDFIYPTYGA